LATDTQKAELHPASVLSKESISCIEQEIDRLTAFLPPLTSFILPGGSPAGALCHVCRTITRRVERRIFDVNDIYPIDNHVFVYVNRLSDYFFALSRYLTLRADLEENYWKA
jgi:cob(I)alamin adenosyltransferase